MPVAASAKITPDERVTFTPPSGQTGTFRCKYTVANQQGLSDQASIIVTVTPAVAGNHPPDLITSALFPT